MGPLFLFGGWLEVGFGGGGVSLPVRRGALLRRNNRGATIKHAQGNQPTSPSSRPGCPPWSRPSRCRRGRPCPVVGFLYFGRVRASVRACACEKGVRVAALAIARAPSSGGRTRSPPPPPPTPPLPAQPSEKNAPARPCGSPTLALRRDTHLDKGRGLGPFDLGRGGRGRLIRGRRRSGRLRLLLLPLLLLLLFLLRLSVRGRGLLGGLFGHVGRGRSGMIVRHRDGGDQRPGERGGRLENEDGGGEGGGEERLCRCVLLLRVRALTSVSPRQAKIAAVCWCVCVARDPRARGGL